MPPPDVPGTVHALFDFKPFPKIPNCIKFMIWEEFYRQPRYFTTYPVFQGRSREYESEIPLGWSLKPRPQQKSYHDAIDTQIDQLSSFFASRVRPRFTIEVPLKATDEDQPHKPTKRRSKRKAKVTHVNINWNIDFIHVKTTIHEGSGNLIPQVEWFSNIRNMVLDNDLLNSHHPGGITTDMISFVAFCLWERKGLLGSLRNLALKRVPWHRKRDVDTPLLCFQVRYLLREAPAKPPQWKDLQVSVVSKSPWLDIERHGGSEEVQCKHFVENIRSANERWANPRRDISSEVTGDEITDTRLVFSKLLSPSGFLPIIPPVLLFLIYFPMSLELQFLYHYNELVSRTFISGS